MQTNTIDILPFCEKTTEIDSQNEVVSKNTELQLSTTYSPLIACIDDSRTVHKHIQKTLEIIGYQTLS